MEVKSDAEDADTVWMASANDNLKVWLAELNKDEYNVWDEQEESWEDDIFSSKADTNSMPDLVSVYSSLTSLDDLFCKSDISKLTFEVDVTAEWYWANTRHVSESFFQILQKVVRCLTLYWYPTLLREVVIVKMMTVQMKLVIYLIN